MSIANQIFLGTVLIINLSAFLIMFIDKEKAKGAQRRISEKALFIWALFFGAAGIYAGMFAFRHKTKKWYFFIGIPFIILSNAYLINKIFLAFSDNIG